MSTYQKQLEWSRSVTKRNNEMSRSVELQKDKDHASMFKPKTSYGSGGRMRIVDEGGRSKDHKSLHVHRQEKARLEKTRVHSLTINKKHLPPSTSTPHVYKPEQVVRLVDGDDTPGSSSNNTHGYRQAYEEEQLNPSNYASEHAGVEDEGFFYDQLVKEREEWGEERRRMLNVIQVQQLEIERIRGEGREKAVEVARTFGDAVGVFEERLIGVEQGVAQELKLLRSRLGERGEDGRLEGIEKQLKWIVESMGGKAGR
ncbi:hypothetical protein TrLO_g13980 [Triparma laevis f. longispina]|uniref:Uncharacterized protein n=1 Tax=Triparma laevis f. longispina TaxID=1714387 RepID=A0A9W7CCP4_9STRA|nr:hypothetical protein TrLO_g13980 [Triparma laevis f. longispina]